MGLQPERVHPWRPRRLRLPGALSWWRQHALHDDGLRRRPRCQGSSAPCCPCTALRDPFSLPAPQLALPPLDTSASLLSLRSRTSCLAPRSAPSSTFRMRGTTAGPGTPTRALAPGKRCRRPTSTGTLRTPSTRPAMSRTARTRTSSLAWPVPSHPDPALPMPLPCHPPSRQAPIQRLPPTGNPGTGAALGSGCESVLDLAIQVQHLRDISK